MHLSWPRLFFDLRLKSGVECVATKASLCAFFTVSVARVASGIMQIMHANPLQALGQLGACSLSRFWVREQVHHGNDRHRDDHSLNTHRHRDREFEVAKNRAVIPLGTSGDRIDRRILEQLHDLECPWYSAECFDRCVTVVVELRSATSRP